MATTQIRHVDRETFKSSPVVTFTLKDGVAVGKWVKGNEDFRRDIEESGIVTLDHGVLFPKDGQKFLSALAASFANSSQIEVIKLDS